MQVAERGEVRVGGHLIEVGIAGNDGLAERGQGRGPVLAPRRFSSSVGSDCGLRSATNTPWPQARLYSPGISLLPSPP